MKIASDHRAALLQLPHVGERILLRLEEAGLASLEAIAASSVPAILRVLQQRSDRTKTIDMWVRSSLARVAVMNIVRYARNSRVLQQS